MKKRMISLVMALCIAIGMLAGMSITASAAEVTVNIVSFRRGAQADLRSSELLEARVKDYDGNVRELTYEWTNELGTYLYVYNSHNMYGINNTVGEIEIYNSSVESSENMVGHSYKDTFKGEGYAWAAVYGANLSNTSLEGTVTVKVYDKNGNLIAQDSHTGTVKQSGSWWRPTYTYSGFVSSNLKDDLNNIVFGMFENDTKSVNELLGESAMVHVTCVECGVTNCRVSNSNNVKVTGSSGNYTLTGVKKGTASVTLNVKKSNCKFHQNVTTNDTVITAYVYKKPTTSTTTTTVTLGNLDDDCRYMINGSYGEKQSDGTILFENLTPNTTYEVEVIGQASGTAPVYAYVYATTLPVHPVTVKVYLDGGVVDGVPYGTLTDIETFLGSGAKVYLKSENNTYYELTKTSTGVYEANLADGTYYIYSAPNASSQICEQQVTVLGGGRERELFFYSVTYDANGGTYAGETLEYHHDDNKVMVSSVVPVKDGYDFMGWVDESGKTYQSGDVLAEEIYNPYKLTAIWEKTKYAKVNVTVVATHGTSNGADPHPESGSMHIELAYRHNDSEPYVEYVGKNNNFSDWYERGTNSGNTTTVTFPELYKELHIGYEYSATVVLDDYYVTGSNVTSTTDAEGNITYDVTINISYSPDLFNLEYKVVADNSIPSDLVPKAVDMKVLSWDANVDGEWAPISRHVEYSTDVELSGRNGNGSYAVPVYRNENENYYYRAAAVGFTLADGTELTASSTDGINFYSDANDKYGKGAFYAVIDVNGGADVDGTDLDGAYGIYAQDTATGYKQQGTITVTIYMNRYDVIFDTQGGEAIGAIPEQFRIPDVSMYVPFKDGYTFAGWYTTPACTDGTEVVVGQALTSDITLYAKWLENRTIQGTITVAGFYMLDGEKVQIPENDRLESEIVLLQKIDHNGYFITLASDTVDVSYSGDYGTAQFEFTDIANDDEEYRITILSHNYEVAYQNELSSSTEVTNYNAYDANHYKAEFNGDVNATVNAYLHFEPVDFELLYSIDASALGEGYRPSSAETVILCNDGSTSNPQTWSPISQMLVGGNREGQDTALSGGKGDDSYPVWTAHADGTTLYEYAISVDSLVFDGEKVEYTSDAPFAIYYNGSARFSDINGQTQLLTATVVPKLYEIVFDLGVDAEEIVTGMNGYHYHEDHNTYGDTYYWSYGKQITATPVREGYTFLGWYDAEGNQVTVVTPDMAENITLYARWTQDLSFQVLADAGYYSAERNSADKVGVISLNAHINDIETVIDSIVSFGIYVYDNSSAETKIITESVNKETLLKNNGCFHTIISDIAQENFGKVFYGMPFAVIDADGNDATTDDRKTVVGEFFSTSVSDVNKWLGAENVYAN